MSSILGAVCNRCSTPYLIRQWPHNGLCPDCHLGAMTPEQRERVLAHAAQAGRSTR